VDAEYRGEVKIALIHLGQEAMEIQDQDRVAQAVLCPVLQAKLEVVESLSSTQRGEGGFGSTGFTKP
jgi:dUTP pyrophosphatase